jgi:quinol monooxygenase YgiN
MIGVVAKFKVKEGKADEVIKLFEEIVPHVRQEEGTLFYTLNRDTANPNILIVMERYRDKDALRVHSKTPHFLAMFPKIGPLLEENPELSILEELVSI